LVDQQSPQQPYGYGEPTPMPPGPPSFAQPAPQPSNGIAVVGLILAFLVPPVGLILSIIGLAKSGRAGRRGMAIAGLVIGLVFTLGIGGIVYAVSQVSALDPGCGTAQSAVTDNAGKISSPATLQEGVQATIDGLGAAESKATHDNVRNAIKALKDDYSQLLAAANAGDLTKINQLQATLTADATAFDKLCPVDLRK